MNYIKLIFRAKPTFYGKKGYWGEHGWKQIGLIKWLRYRKKYVTKIEWGKDNE